MEQGYRLCDRAPKNVLLWSNKDNLLQNRGKADGFNAPEGSNPGDAMASWPGHHRGLWAGHVFKGVARELGRANCLLAVE